MLPPDEKCGRSMYFDEIGPGEHSPGHDRGIAVKMPSPDRLACSLGTLAKREQNFRTPQQTQNARASSSQTADADSPGFDSAKLDSQLLQWPKNGRAFASSHGANAPKTNTVLASSGRVQTKYRAPSLMGPPVPPALVGLIHGKCAEWVPCDKIDVVPVPSPRQKAVRGACILERMNQLLSRPNATETGDKEAPCHGQTGLTEASEPNAPAHKRRRLQVPISLSDFSADLSQNCGKTGKVEVGERVKISEAALVAHATGFRLSSSRADSQNWRHAQVIGVVYANDSDQSRDVHDYVLILAHNVGEADVSGEGARSEIRQAEDAEIVTVPGEIVQDALLCVRLGGRNQCPTSRGGRRGQSDFEQRSALEEQTRLAR